MAINEFEVCRREARFCGVQFFAKLGDGCILQGTAQPVPFDAQSSLLAIRAQVGRGNEDPAQESPGIIISLEPVPEIPRPRRT